MGLKVITIYNPGAPFLHGLPNNLIVLNKVDVGKLEALLDKFPLSQHKYSASFLHVFKYHASTSPMPCPPHTDSGLVTIIPCAKTPELEVLVGTLNPYTLLCMDTSSQL